MILFSMPDVTSVSMDVFWPRGDIYTRYFTSCEGRGRLPSTSPSLIKEDKSIEFQWTRLGIPSSILASSWFEIRLDFNIHVIWLNSSQAIFVGLIPSLPRPGHRMKELVVDSNIQTQSYTMARRHRSIRKQTFFQRQVVFGDSSPRVLISRFLSLASGRGNG